MNGKIDHQDVASSIKRSVVDSLLPFWNRALDHERGGVFTCWNNPGTQLVSRDKYTWSQGRFVFLWSRVADAMARGILPGEPAGYLAHAELTIRFLKAYAFLGNGDCAFLLSESGEKKEPFPGRGFATSIYADCFVAMGLAEFARVAKKPEELALAWRIFDRIEKRIAAGGFPSDPDPIPAGREGHGIAMITLNVALVISEACDALGAPRAPQARQRCAAGVEDILTRFLIPGGRMIEMRPADGALRDDLLTRHVNPGHALECLWLVLTVAQREQRRDWIERAKEAISFSCHIGWDETWGGLLHFVDYLGGPPVGANTGTIYEGTVTRTWEKKLWWVHSEAIYATLLAYRMTGDAALWDLFKKVFAYTFATFPQPDPSIGEWIQIRDQRGAPVEQVVALPVKDPYHILRNLIMALEVMPSGKVASK
ncbi:MAG: N-acylglucosamine 2-epimerase [Lacunisphaera sp.]|nr:N-acylglucosamine 2-epimerase [Lacunisphaera sp.]